MKKIALVLILCFTVFLAWNLHIGATAEYTKETGKKCKFCHTGVPKKGADDPLLNEDGKVFMENGNQLTEEQKQRSE
jgi:hypothetical protein